MGFKIRSKKQGWQAFKLGYLRANKLLMKGEICREDKAFVGAYEQIIRYERLMRNIRVDYFMATDWQLYRLSWQDAIRDFNRLFNGGKDVWKMMGAEERDFLRAVIIILDYVREKKYGNMDRMKLYLYSKKLNGLIYASSRGKRTGFL